MVLKRRSSSLGRLQGVVNSSQMADIEDGLGTVFAAAKFDAVIHLATSYGRNGQRVSDVFDTNARFALHVLEAAADAGVPTFINTDTSLDKFLNPYALSKRQFAEWGQSMATQGRISFVNIRLEHMYGPGDDDSKFATHVVRSLLGEVPELSLTKGEQLRDFVYIDDVVTAFHVLLDAAASAPDRTFIECDLGSGTAVSIRDFVEMAQQLTGSPTLLRFGAVPYRDGEVMLTRADVSYLNGLGWTADTSLADGLKKLIASEKEK